MKKMKKLASLVLALAMALTLAVPAMAANADLTGHTYKAYQIFSGTQATEGDASQLGNIQWGSGINDTTFLAALKADETIGNAFTDCATAADVADAMKGWADKSPEAEAFAKVAYANKTGSGVDCEVGTTPLAAGYYLIVDETVFSEGTTNTVYNLALLQLTKKDTFEIENKTAIPEVEKKVKDTNDTTGVTTGWQDSADYDIGDEIPFQLKGTLPENYDDYTEYYFAFHDKEGDGLTFKYNEQAPLDEAVVVKVGDTVIDDEYYDVTFALQGCADDCTFHVVFNNLKAIKDVELVGGSEITVYYTSILNENADIGQPGNPNEVQLEYSNNPNAGGHGKTPWDKVVVFTYDVVVDKTDDKGDPLAGAEFTLSKKIGSTWVVVGRLTVDQAGTTFTWTGLDDGDYKLEETATPLGYNTIDPIEFTIEAEHQTSSADPQLSTLVVKNADNEVISGDNEDFKTNVAEGKVDTDIVNQSGATLPETGGMGTTLFYALGAVLVIGAGVAMVTKKRMA